LRCASGQSDFFARQDWNASALAPKSPRINRR
jgi:hypothetical protein